MQSYSSSRLSSRLRAFAVLFLTPDPSPLTPFSLCVICGFFFLGLTAQGQGINAKDFYGKEPMEGVYVRDSSTVLEKLALAERMERLREWGKSADLYQEIVEKWGDRVVPRQFDKEKEICQYTSVIDAVQERLSRWPGEGLNVYRGKYEAAADAMLEGAGREDYAALGRIFNRYFVSEAGKKAGLGLMELYWENGEFGAVTWAGDRLLQWHPGLLAERAGVLFRVGLAYHAMGNDEVARSQLAELKKQYANAVGKVGGKDAILAEVLEKELEGARMFAGAGAGDSGPTVGGGWDRGRISTALGRSGAKLFSVELPKAKLPVGNINLPPGVGGDVGKDAAMAQSLGIIPSIDRGALFFQDGSRIYGVSLDSGLKLPGWATAYTTVIPVGARRGQLTVTVTADSVLATMGWTDRLAAERGEPNPENQQNRLVCLDRTTGKVKWVAYPKQLPEEAGGAREVEFSGSPLVVGPNVYVIGRGGRGGQFEDCYAICLDAANGKYRWACYLASANTGAPMWGGDPFQLSNGNVSHLAYSSGRLYVTTNVGAVAAVDAYNGTIAWLNLYPRDVVMDRDRGFIRRGAVWKGNGEGMMDAPKPWEANAAIVQKGRVFAMPADGKHVLVYDAGTGAELKRIKTTDFGDVNQLLGVLDEKMVLAGAKRVWCINWKNYEAEKFDDRDERVIFWPQTFKSEICGRGFVTADSVFVPTKERLFRVSLKSGKIEEAYPKYPQAWEEGEGPGNVMAVEDRLVLAREKRVDVYADLDLTRAKLDREVGAAPGEAGPRLKYAEVMFASGQGRESLRKLDEAIGLLGGVAGMRPGNERERVFNDALNFAQKLTKRGGDGEWARLADELFDRAGATAGTTGQRVNYLVSRAKLAEAKKDTPEEIGLYQQILMDATMRLMMVREENGGMKQAGTIAEETIRELIQQAKGKEFYQQIEKQAEKALEQARGAKDAEQLVAVSQAYPNSEAAMQALMAASEKYEQGGQRSLAARMLRQAYYKYPQASQMPTVVEGLARNYAAMPGRLGVAIARLEQGGKMFANPKLQQAILLPDGLEVRGVTFLKAAEILRKVNDEAGEKMLPDLRIPTAAQWKAAGKNDRIKTNPFLEENANTVIAGVGALVKPMRAFARYDRVVTWSAEGKVGIYEVGKGQAISEAKVMEDMPTQAAWMGNNLLVWSDDEMAMLCEEGKRAGWKIALKQLPDVAVVGKEEVAESEETKTNQGNEGLREIRIPGGGRLILRGNGPVVIQGRLIRPRDAAVKVNGDDHEQIAYVRPVGTRIIAGTTKGRVMAVENATGRVTWQMKVNVQPVNRLVANEDFVAMSTKDEAGSSIIVLDATNGQILSRRDFGVDDGPRNMVLGGDGTLVYTLSDRLCGKDLYEPGMGLKFEVKAAEGARPYWEAEREDQLTVAGGRVLVVSNTGDELHVDGNKYVKVHSLETGKLMQYVSAESGKETEAILNTEVQDWNVGMRVEGSWLYVRGQKTLVAYDLDHPDQSWRKYVGSNSTENIQDMLIGRDYLMLINRPEGANGGVRLQAFSINGNGKGERGLWVYNAAINEPANVSTMQAVDGGVYYLSGDGKLHYLRGGRQ